MTLPLFGYVSLGVDVCYFADNHLCIHYLCSSQQHYVAFPVWILSPHLFLFSLLSHVTFKNCMKMMCLYRVRSVFFSE